MSDKVRRRKSRESGDSEKLSEDSFEDNEIPKGSEEVRLNKRKQYIFALVVC
jgi:hypothetical protein